MAPWCGRTRSHQGGLGYIRWMATQRAFDTRRGGSGGRGPHPARRSTDATMLDGHARPLSLGSVAAVVIGVVLAFTGSSTLAPYAFVLSSVVAIGLLGAAQRADTAARPNYTPDRSSRTRRVSAAVIVLAVVGTATAAWTLTADLAR
jgi:hypothetical protein